MPRARAQDGVELHWEERGSGPAVVLVPYWSYEPRVWEPVTAELEDDHRVIRYDDRGTGQSERTGPFDIETSANDLEAVIEAAGAGPAVALAMVDGGNRAARVAQRRPDLLSHVVGVGGPPLTRDAFTESESLISSSTVVAAFLQQLDTDYRGAIRSLMEAGNPQMSQDELRDRVVKQVEHVPMEAASARVRAWAEDADAAVAAREMGDRLLLLVGGNAAGGWFPDESELTGIITEHFPEAVVEHVEEGILSRPDQTAAVVRRVATANVESPA
jgi:pimeloyl-ACP methyl ester carboxylesterase